MRNIFDGLLKALLLSYSLMIISGCQTVGQTLNLDTDLRLTINVEADVNPDDAKKPSPLFLRFYELQSNKVFENADFIDLYERDGDVLGADMVAKQELRRLTPGEQREENFVLNPQTQYIALYAEFYNYNDSQFRVVFPVEANNVFQDKIKIKITGNKMTLIEK
ncbi:type VI secretion system lipoprotein TssJ [Aliikangiella sp. G2MR2-5]|uniref:type VI secretion system lipoprotein TssJ n=1 Tax=Aliikangiella sp. G2MR2-5 TaxID=2788943 RepID=UPI0018AB6F0E|nr:type VI secretion system lipoprotein TssJ [Aliikangiella sp. G2MR2-5]